MHIYAFAIAHAVGIGYGLAVWIAFASLANRTFFPQPAATAPKILRVLHELLIDAPAFLASKAKDGHLGPFVLPFLGGSLEPGAPSSSGARPNLNLVPLLIFAVLGLSGCAAGLADSYVSLTVQERALGVAVKDLPEVSKHLQLECITSNDALAEGAACVQRVRSKVAVAEKSITGLQATTVTAKDMIQGSAGAASAPKQLMPWIGLAIRGYVDLQAAMATLGYSLGGP